LFDLHPEKVGTWSTEEIYLALENGYELIHIYQIIHFDETTSSETIFRGYIANFLRLKQENEGWKKCGYTGQGEPSEEIKDQLVEQLYQDNGYIAKMRKEKVKKDAVARHINKINLNCLWGKFCQRQSTENTCEITNQLDFEQLCYSSGLNPEKMSFRNIYDTKWVVKYEKETDQAEPNNRVNIFLSAMVTAQARCILHRRMLKIGPERVLYCDTDSIVFLYPINAPTLEGRGLGNWVSETSEKIMKFMASAPKCYYILTDQGHQILKVKGNTLTKKNTDLLKFDKFREIILSTIHYVNSQKTIILENFSIFPNVSNTNIPYATMVSRYNQKVVKGVFTKRKIDWVWINKDGNISKREVSYDNPLCLEECSVDKIARIQLFPFGYQYHN